MPPGVRAALTRGPPEARVSPRPASSTTTVDRSWVGSDRATLTFRPFGRTRTDAGPSQLSSRAEPARQKLAARSPSAPRRTACTAVESAISSTGGAADSSRVRPAEAVGSWR